MYFRIKSFLNNLCIGLDGDNNVVMKENDDGDSSQFWTWNDDNDSLRNKDGMALDVYGGDDDAGTKVIGYPHHGGENQQWDIRDALVISKLNGMVLDLEGGNTNPGARVIVWPRNDDDGTSNQQWTVTHIDD